jgi:hypothetical protein
MMRLNAVGMNGRIPMNNEVPWYVSLIMAWLPFLMLIGVGLWMSLTIRTALRTRDGRSVAQTLDDLARGLRRSNDLLTEASEGQRRKPDALGPKL